MNKKVKNELENVELLKNDADVFLRGIRNRDYDLEEALYDYNLIKDRNTELKKQFRALLDQKVSALNEAHSTKKKALSDELEVEKVELLNANLEKMEKFQKGLQYENFPLNETRDLKTHRENENMELNPFYIQAKKEVEAEHKKAYDAVVCDSCQVKTKALNENGLCETCQVEAELEEVESIDWNYEYRDGQYVSVEEVEQEVRDTFQIINGEPKKASKTEIINRMFENFNI